MKISASQVNDLRKQTGAGMMDCKNALVESNGNFENAIDILRKKGQKVAAKRADRDASEGCVLSLTNDSNTKAFTLSLNCETDFVAKNENFINLTKSILDKTVKNSPKNLNELLNIQIDGLTLNEKLTEQTGVIGEKIEVGDFKFLEANYVSSYIHPGNRLATIVGFNILPSNPEIVGKDIAMQVAAMNPLSVDKEGIDKTIISRELEIAKDQIRQEGKPENMIDKIANGKLNKFYKENSLLSQSFIKDNKISVLKYLESIDKNLIVTSFHRVSLS
ncbi:MAG: elongation factor Ts [Flavobacteriales bacterium TMED288]|nr:elongation factor Ts [Flavobacteriales bacterium]RPG53798.1 MAG: elongation factor Ts [Flavobacteriales bacterium TMED288]|tara:strand:+ start:5823 stop:6650 length:828 start_codon:yes stop_codon:yes gene_type:complete